MQACSFPGALSGSLHRPTKAENLTGKKSPASGGQELECKAPIHTLLAGDLRTLETVKHEANPVISSDLRNLASVHSQIPSGREY